VGLSSSADDAANAAAFGRPGSGRGSSAYPQIRFVSLVENGTHVLFASRMAGCATGETTLARGVLAGLQPGMLCLADRQFFGFAMWQQARGTGADLLWRIKKNVRLPCDQRLPDGSSLSHLYACGHDRRRKTNGVMVRVIEYRLEGVAGAEPLYRLVWDNLAGHKTPEMVLWLCRHGIMPLYTPLSSSWLNLAEAIQRILKRRALDGQHPHSPAEIGAWFEQTAQAWNRQPTPFVWNGKRRQRRRRPDHRHPVGGAAAHTRRSLSRSWPSREEYRVSCQMTH
jgi:hypothetical protein